MTATITRLSPKPKPKRRRRARCSFCGELHMPEHGVRDLCSTCMPAFIEVGQCETMGLLDDWHNYRHVIPALARGQADLVLRDAVATRFHAGWRLLDEVRRVAVEAEIKRLAVEARRASMHLVDAST